MTIGAQEGLSAPMAGHGSILNSKERCHSVSFLVVLIEKYMAPVYLVV